jgi:glycosyltransferase involved in cell wall biosynthesis
MNKTSPNAEPFPSLSVVIPAFNEELLIERTITALKEALEGRIADYEIVVVDDGSTDRTAEILDRLAATHPALKVFRHPHNLFLGSALRTGFSHATKELIFYTDADLPVDFRELFRGYEIMQATRCDVVAGVRANRGGESALRSIVSQVYNAMVNALFQTGCRDVNFAFKLFRRSLLDRVVLRSRGSFVDAEFLAKVSKSGFRIAEIRLGYTHREAGPSRLFKIRHIAQLIYELARLLPEVYTTRRIALASANNLIQ